jgi:Spy/CpxP family protein refolding chaperone
MLARKFLPRIAATIGNNRFTTVEERKVMKFNKAIGLLIVVAATAGTAAAAYAATTATTTTTETAAAPSGKHWHHRHSLLVGTLLRATRQLGLTPQQQQQIKGLIATARSQHQQAAGGAGVDMTVLANPGDPNYAAALQNAKTLAAARIQSESELEGNIYALLTKDQKDKLPQVLADMKTQFQQRRAAWLQQHEAGTESAAGTN